MEADTAQWFHTLGKCSQPGCDKDSIGKVMNTVNASLGSYCRKHGEARVARAKMERAHAEHNKV